MPGVVLSFPAFSLRRIETPFERKPGYKNFVAIIDARDLPDLSKWREINVRDPKGRGRVPKAIRSSFNEKPDEFVFLNRGLVVAADKVELADSPHGKVLKLALKDPEIHGLLDGGHTYRIVREEAKALKADDPLRLIKLEVITGFDREGIGELVEARNTSNQVRDESLQNLNKKFDEIKEILRSRIYFDEISWSEYEELPDGQPKPIDVRDIISFLVTFDVTSFNSTTQPLIAYKDKRACLRHFSDHRSSLRKLFPILPDILLLWDTIHDNWQSWYNEGRADEDVAHGRFGKLSAITQGKEELFFKRTTSAYRMPEAYKYPLLSALRAAIEVKGKHARWLVDPFELLDTTGPQLTAIVGQTVRSTRSPNKVGKDLGTWSSCYLVVESALKGTVSAKQEEKIQQLERELEQLKRTRRSN